jgi:ABC-2 type transport system ATP-binding protein
LQALLTRWKKRGLAIIISSHILPDLAAIADAVGIMERGKMVQSGPIAEIARGVTGAQRYRVEISGGIDKARRVLDERFGATWPIEEPMPGCFELPIENDEQIAGLIEALVLRGVRLRQVAPKESALEAVYRASAVAEVA